jgi:hypothetical protein
MSHPNKDEIAEPHFPGEIELYGDPGIASFDAKVPKFLLIMYLILPIWGLITFFYFWNGSAGWLDRGYWHELQIAANTTFPIENQNMRLEEPIPAEQIPPIKQMK